MLSDNAEINCDHTEGQRTPKKIKNIVKKINLSRNLKH